MTPELVLKTHYVAALAKRRCGDEPQIVTRAGAVIVRRPVEEGRELDRLLLLPPQGFTGNARNQTNSYYEVERATVEIKGAVRAGKQSYSKLKDCLLVVSFNDAARVSGLDQPYLIIDQERLDPGFIRTVHGSGEPPFHVVKADGTGVYHSLINLTDDWLVIALHKVLRPMRTPEFDDHLRELPADTAGALLRFYHALTEQGDQLFHSEPVLVAAVAALPAEQSVPALLEMLHVRDGGKHEACTAFAMILKIGRREGDTVSRLVTTAWNQGSIPADYGHQLLTKLQRLAPFTPNRDRTPG